MARTTSYTLTEQDEEFIQAELAAGRAKTASEVMRDALARSREHRRLVDELDRALDAGLESPLAPPGSFDRVLAKLRAGE